MGLDGVKNLYEFVEQGGTLIVEGSTATIFPSYNLTSGIAIEEPDSLFARGSVMRGVITDMTSPIVYGYGRDQLPVYFSQGPVLRVERGAGFGGFGFGRRGAVTGQDVTPMATPMPLSPWNPDAGAAAGTDSTRRRAFAGRGAPGRAGARAAAGNAAERDTTPAGPRMIMAFPQRASDILLSGTLVDGDALAGRAQVIDERIGKGHIVMFAIRPFWRWQTQGTYFLAFNAILNWDHLDAGKPSLAPSSTAAGQ